MAGCLDVSQLSIKINQNTQTDGGKSKPITQANATGTSFDQVLAMINQVRLPESNMQSAATPLQDIFDVSNSIQALPDSEDLEKLDSILTELIACFQQGQPLQITALPSTENQASNGKSLQNDIVNDREVLSQWLQKVEGLTQTSALDSSQLIQKGALITGQPLSGDNQKINDVPYEIGKKIRMILNTTADKLLSVDDNNQAKSDLNGQNQIEPLNLSVDDLANLDSILMTLLAGMQQGEQAQTTTGQQPQDNEYSVNHQQPLVIPKLLSLPQQGNYYVGKDLDQWLQKVDRLNQPSTVDSSQLLQRLALFIEKLKSQESQNPNEVPNEIEDKLQFNLEIVKPENILGVGKWVNQQSPENVLKFDDIKQNGSLESKPQLILDKDKVMLSSMAHSGTSMDNETMFDRVPVPNNEEDQTLVNNLSLMVNQLQEGLEKSSASKFISTPPTLSVSDFVPEVSEWLGGYMRSTNNQSGGTEAKFSLYPAHLGHIEIKITTREGQVSAQIVADTLMAKEALESQLPQLRQALQQHGLHVQKLDITQQTPASIDSSQANLSFSQGGSNSSHDERTFTPAQNGSKSQKASVETGKELESFSTTYGGADPKTASRIDFTA